MEKWEYLAVELWSYRVKSVNGQTLPTWGDGTHYIAYFNQLGADGWEFVVAAETPGVTEQQYIFKRRKP